MELYEIKNYSVKKMQKFCEQTELKELHNLKLYLDDLYYNTDAPGVTDELYDILKDFLLKRDPTYIPPVGAKIRYNDNKVNIPFWLGSADKITPTETKELDRFVANNPSETHVVSEKLDGCSGLFIVVNGKQKLYTRGDGIIGSDISHLLRYFHTSIPRLRDDIAVRGEIIISKKNFEKYKHDSSDQKSCRIYKNARNMVAGLINAKTARSGLSYIDFVAYEIVGNETMSKPSNQLATLKNLGFITAMNETVNPLTTMNSLIDMHKKFKKNSKYEIDGIIVSANKKYDRNTSGNPSYMFAFKTRTDDNIAETIVLDIEWSVTKWGQIIPVIITDPVELSGVTLSRVTGSNAKLLMEKQIGPGAIVRVTRSNDVIPFIESVVEECETMKMPDVEYDWDDNNVHLIVSNPSTEIVDCMKIKMFSSFFKKMNIKFVSEATVKKLYNNGFKTLLDIIGASKEELMEIGDFKEKSATRIYDNIRNGLKEVKTTELLGASGIFGYGIGEKRVISLMTDIPDLLETKHSDLKRRILKVEGFSEIIAKKIMCNLELAIKFVTEISKYSSFQEDTRISDSMIGQKFCFSGFRDKNMEKSIENRGGKITASISKKTSGIIVASIEANATEKVSKAISLGVPVYTREEFNSKFL